MDSRQANTSVADVSVGLLLRLKAHASLILSFFAILLTVLAVWGALYQKPHFNAYRTAPSLMSRDYWAYPIEQNAFRRLPVIGSILNDVFALPGGKHIWAVGDEGLIVHSGDGGFTWEKQQVVTDTAEPKPPPLSGFSLLSEAWAEMPPTAYPPVNAEQQRPSQRVSNQMNEAAQPLVPNANQADTTNKSPAPPVIPKTENIGQLPEQTVQPEVTITPSKSLPKKAVSLPKQADQSVISKQTPPAVKSNAAKQAPVPPVKPESPKSGQPTEQTVQPAVSKQTPFSEDLMSVLFIDANHGWAVGTSGVIVATQDGGTHWQAQPSGTGELLSSVAFADAKHGWAVGASGVIVATQDGGTHWQAQPSGTEEKLTGVAFADAEHGWAVRASGVIVATQDGGTHWQAQPSGTEEQLHDVAFADAEHGWAVGASGVIVATQDGGTHWQAQPSGTGESLVGVAFADAEHGWAVGASGVIVATQDGGTHWQAQPSGTGELLSSVAFADAKHGWAMGTSSVIVATQDGGTHWQAQSSGTEEKLTGVAFADAEHGWAVRASGVIVATQDGGTHWQAQPSGTEEQLHDVAFADAEHGWAVGASGVIVATQDGGTHWQAQPSGTGESLVGVAFADAEHGWAVGTSSVIVATQDGGTHWQTQPSGTETTFYGVAFADAEHGWAVGENGVIVATQDGGTHWQTQPSGTGEQLFGVAFADAEHGWAVVRNGVILATQDGGTHWQAQPSGTGEMLFSVAFADAEHGWAVGDNGVIGATLDGGKHWQAQPSGTGESLVGVAFTDAEHGWAVGTSGAIVVTQDGGKHWQDIVYRRFPAPWFYVAMLAAVGFFGFAGAIFAKQGPTSTPQAGIANQVVTDKPAGPGSPDFLGARRIALELTRFLVNRNTQPPVTIAITGEWGSGKSSIMNFLFAGLKREGLSPVWFNAWHHREEQNVLASILANVHQHAIKPWWTCSGFWFRLRLLWKRNWLIKSLLLTMLFATSLLLTWLISSPGKWRETQDYALYLLHVEEPVIFTEKSFKSYCPVIAPASGKNQQATANSDKTPTKTAATTATNSQPDAKPGNSSQAVPRDAHTVNKSTGQPRTPSIKADAPKETTTAQDLFDPDQCRLLQDLSGPPIKYRSSFQCRDGAADHCYVNPNEFLKTVEQRLSIELTSETEAKLLKALEHLHPDPPVTVSPALLNWLAGLVALLGLLTVNGMALLGLAPVQMFQGFLNKSGVVLQPAEAVGTRLLFERHFKLITALLGQRRLVLFIDDLDRCDREYTRKVLEITNFLSSSGDLFMVLGMAPRYVLANVTLSFQDLAKAVHEADMLNGDASDNRSAGESWFARQYLQKLIHIEVPVPKAKIEQVLAMLKAEPGEPDKTEELEKQLDSLLAISGKLLRLVLLVGALGYGAYWGYSLGLPQQVEPVVQDAVQKVAKSGEGSNSVDKGIKNLGKPETKATSKPEEVFIPGYTAKNFVEWPLWVALLLTVGLFSCGLGLFYLMRHLELIRDKNWLSWLEPLLRRLKVKLLGPELRDDSVSFTDALDIWHGLIAFTEPSPRNIKAFLNRLRYFASRYTGAVDNQHEAQLVALATMHYAFDEDMNEAIALMQAYETNTSQSVSASSSLREVKRREELDAALKAHLEKFSAFPSQQDRDFFKDLCEDIRIHKREK